MEIKGYTIEREISRGPITTVYLAIQNALERQVLLKVLNVQWGGEEDLVARFKREAKIYARLKHANIVNIFDFGTSGEHLYLAMEFVEGENLNQNIKKYHPLPFPVVLFITREIVKGLNYAHSQGVIHRDVKPANILIGLDGVVKITDFGLATIKDFPSVTAQGGAVGTPAYMSPEQASAKSIDFRSDLFNLGATIYEMASGESPFKGKSVAESIQRVFKDNPLPLSKKRPDIPEAFSGIVQKLLEKNPAKRPVTDALLEQPELTTTETNRFLASFLKRPVPHKIEIYFEPPSFYKRNAGRIFILLLLVFILPILFAISRFNREPAGKIPPEAVVSKTDTTIQTGTIPSVYLKEDSILRSDTAVPKPSETKLNDAETKEMALASANSPTSAKAGNHLDNGETNGESRPEKAPNILPEFTDPPDAGYMTGQVFIVCEPWADIFIDNKKIDTTPLLNGPVELPAGSYFMELRNPHYQTYRDSIFVRPNVTDTLTFVLDSALGYLDLIVVPWARVYINDQFWGETPLDKPIPLPVGRHELKLANPYYTVWEDSIRIQEGPQELKISLIK